MALDEIGFPTAVSPLIVCCYSAVFAAVIPLFPNGLSRYFNSLAQNMKFSPGVLQLVVVKMAVLLAVPRRLAAGLDG
jgi:hypothetical protein